MALTVQQKVDIRRHLGVPASGIAASNYVVGLRTILRVGQLELYMNVLSAEEESVVTGYPLGLLRIFGDVVAGNTVTATINGTPVTYTATSNDASSTQPLFNVAAGLAAACNNSNLVVFGAAASIIGAGEPPYTLPNFAQITFSSPTTFTLTGSSSGLSTAILANGATYPSPALPLTNPDNSVTTYYGYIPICNFLEGQIGTATANLSLRSAGGLSTQAAAAFRQDEVGARRELYDFWRMQLGNFLSVGPNPAGRGGMGSHLGITV